MTLVTQAEFAKLHGVSRKTVTKWKDGDYLVLSEGKVDVAGSDALLKERSLGKFGKVSAAVTPAKVGNKHGNNAPVRLPSSSARAPDISRPSDGYRQGEEEGDGLDGFVHDSDEFIDDILAGRHVKTSIAERIKENNIALKHVLDMRQRAGSLVEMESAEKRFFEVSRASRDAWMDFPTKIGPLIAADLDIEADRVVEVLTKYVQSQLEKLGNPGAEFEGETGSADARLVSRMDAPTADQPA